eukprot:jgi/Mesen1/6507/ME000332S05514
MYGHFCRLGCADGDFSLLSKKNNASKLLFRDSQAAVGKGLGVICQTLKCKFVINNGDNFYNLGIDKELGVTDPQFKTSFHDIYNAKSLRVPFYGVLGNHDYGRDTEVAAHSIVPQLEYTQVDPSGQWVLPSRFYSVLPPTAGTGINVQLTMFDTSPLLKNYCTDNTSTYYTPELLYGCQVSALPAQPPTQRPRARGARACISVGKAADADTRCSFFRRERCRRLWGLYSPTWILTWACLSLHSSLIEHTVVYKSQQQLQSMPADVNAHWSVKSELGSART